MFDAIVVGSGPAGVFATYGLAGKNVLMLDVGKIAPKALDLEGNLFSQRRGRADLFEPLIGNKFESLHNVHRRNVSLKLKSPYMSYIIEDWERLSPVSTANFEAVMSFAKGGLANAWGAGVYRFDERDLQEFPLSSQDLTPYYDELTDHIGISGTSDDLDGYFGTTKGLQPPLRIARFSAELLGKYRKNREFFRSRGIHIGAPRLAVLTQDHGDRTRYQYENLEFFKPGISAIYNPAFTLDKLIDAGKVRYQGGVLAVRYTELKDRVEVQALDLKSTRTETVLAKSLFLAAGALNTAKLVLQSSDDVETELPILDNPMSAVPLFRWTRIGSALETEESSLAQLNLIYDGPAAPDIVQASFYGTTGPLRTDVIFDFPLTVSANLSWAKYLAPAMGLIMAFYAGKHLPGNYLKLSGDGSLKINYETEKLGAVESELIRAFRKVGYWGALGLCRYPKIGSSLHYAGTLPMRRTPARYQTDPHGRLHGSGRVYVTDGACFSGLPAKNLTFTIMANALRIARTARQVMS